MSATTSRRWTSLSKGQAFSIHLMLSILIFSSLVAVMFLWWFPGELFFLDGGWQGLKLVALVDLVLGPALTLLLYKPGKPKLVMDMSLIATFQIAALAYGFYATHQQRVVAVVYADRNFTTLSASAVENAKIELHNKNVQAQNIFDLDDRKPAMVLTPEPGPGEFNQYVHELLNGYPEPHERIDQFVKRGPEHAKILSERAVTRENLESIGADVHIDAAVEKGGFNKEDIEIHHFKARYAKGLVIFSQSEQSILDFVPIDWNELNEQKTAELEGSDTKSPDIEDEGKATLAESDEQ